MKNLTIDSGILLINKPKDISSFGVVSRVRKMLGMRKVGHLGTLDPFAVGLLPVVFGRGTRLTQYLIDHDKTYRVQVALGVATETMDRDGAVIAESTLSDKRLRQLLANDCRIIRHAVDSLVGVQEQKPPMYSAVKIEGKPLYHYARLGEEKERAARVIEVYRAELLGVKQDYSRHSPQDKTLLLDIIIECSKGTYIRVLADELGRRLDSVAHASELERVKVGSMSNEQAIELAEAESLFYNDFGQDNRRWISYVSELGHVLSLERAVADFLTQNLSYDDALKIASGMAIPVSAVAANAGGGQIQQPGPLANRCDTAVFTSGKSTQDLVDNIIGNRRQSNIFSLFLQDRLVALARLTEDDKIQPETVFITRDELLREKENGDS
ncbi:MAG TPA: tRNA pseudouridine(55) synthase TruB [Clostridiaceae bacterium]|nr:tRNA pseudouridine(55) synthase TruB [Clostridiaceae bacterium]